MRKTYITCLSLFATGAIFCSAILAEDIVYNPYRDVAYKKPTDWQYAQGLCCDGIYYYFAGHHDKTKENADIHKIRVFDNLEVALFEKKGPMHSAELLWFRPHDTLLACSGGNNRKPFVWELNKENGTTLNQWDFEGMGENGGALIAWIKDEDIYLFTSSQDGGRIAFTHVTLKENGQFIDHDTWHYSETNLGVPQGLDYRDGFLYYLADAGKTVNDNPHSIYKIKLEEDQMKTVSILEEYRVDIPVETEGLSIAPDGSVYFGTAEEKIYKLDSKYDKLVDYRKK